MSLKNTLIRNISNLPGARVSQKTVVIESDDWGSIRMPSLEVYEKLKAKGLDLDSGDSKRYNQNDTLASAEDLKQLFGLLRTFKDFKNNHPVFTAVSLVANPDFEKIRKHQFKEYFWEPLPITLEKHQLKDAFELWKEGIKEKLFIPQFHGREHLNIATWLRELQNENREAHMAFDEGIWGFTNKHPLGIMYQAAFDLERLEDLVIQREAIESGLDLFEQLFGYKARFFVPPNGPFNTSLEKVAFNKGVEFMSASKIQLEVLGAGKTQKKYHWLGQKNAVGQYYITRNCFFEPGQPGKDWIASCLNDMEIAFRWKKPAVISSHRVNYIGGLNHENRANGLNAIGSLLESILKRWPDVEFKTSTELGDILTYNHQI